MSRSAALTVSHDLDRVQSLGIRVVEDAEASQMSRRGDYEELILGDLQIDHVKRIVKGMGVPFEFDVIAVCAQDHGMPPRGVSHLNYRHEIFKASLDGDPFPHALLHEAHEVPQTFNRLKSIAQSALSLGQGRVYVMDSGMAAILGASMDLEARKRKNILVLDLATSHTVGATLVDGELAGFFEYHTRDITVEKLDRLVSDLADGKLDHDRILEEGGHGAYLRKRIGLSSVEMIVATGPKRRLSRDSKLPIVYGAPWGDNMMTGTVGLLEAVRRREARPPIEYL